MRFFSALFILFCSSTLAVAQSSKELSVLAWNVESGGSDPEVIAKQLSELNGYDVYCLSEVDDDDFDIFRKAVPKGFVAVNSNSGGGDRLQILFDGNRFDLLEQNELSQHRNFELNNGNHRSPMYVRLKEKTASVEFIMMTNHLARGKADLRTKQAIGLREWARDQNVGVINIGDFNMDYDFHTKKGNAAFPEMLRDNVYHWVKPAELIDTNWADQDGDGKDNYPDSMLDFAFVAGPAKDWKPVCRVIVRDGDFPDNKSTSDHRPIELKLTP
jgi:endonuclease/exonuclease/phosphatase family metal-dependent hydrolase